MCSARNCDGPTGQPARYEDGRSAAVTVAAVPENAGAGAALGIRPRGAVLMGVDANVVVVDGATVVVVDVDVGVVVELDVDVVVTGGFALEELHAAPSAIAARSATHCRRPRRTAS
jgi:hypothetical protein